MSLFARAHRAIMPTPGEVPVQEPTNAAECCGALVLIPSRSAERVLLFLSSGRASTNVLDLAQGQAIGAVSISESPIHDATAPPGVRADYWRDNASALRRR